MSFIKELKRRNIFRMAALYAIAAWVIMQVAEMLNDFAKLPDWIGPAILVPDKKFHEQSNSLPILC